MHKTRTLGQAKLDLFSGLQSQISFSDFCVPAGTLMFEAHDGFLMNSVRMLGITYPGYELEVVISDGRIFIRRNGYYQHSEQYKGKESCHVVVQWDADSIACGVKLKSIPDVSMDTCMRGVKTPFAVPPLELVRTLRTHNLLLNDTYRSTDDLFVTVLDCLHLCEHDIRRHGCERFAWRKDGNAYSPLNEPDISRFVAGYLSIHAAARNFAVICEPITGSGNVDFYVVAPVLHASLGKIAIEAKKADSTNLSHGLEIQLPSYMSRIGTPYGIYLTYWMKSPNYPNPAQESYAQLEIEKLNQIHRLPTVRTVGLDLSYGSTPSQTSR